MISTLFIARPRLAAVLALLIITVGGLAAFAIPVAQYPSIAPPTVVVSAVYIGANAEVVEQSVAQPIEAAMNGVPDMKYMHSASSDSGNYSLTIAFDVGTDLAIAASDVRDRLSIVSARLPTEVRQVGVTVSKTGDDLLQVFAIHNAPGTDTVRDELTLSNYALINVVDAVQRVTGVGNVVLYGQRDYAMRIWLNPQRLDALDLAITDVIAAVEAQNREAAAGSVGTAPAPSGQLEQLSVTTQGRLDTPESFGNIMLLAGRGTGDVHLRDIARVDLGAANEQTGARFNGVPAVAIGVYLEPDANAVSVATAVETTLAELSTRFPEGITYTKLLDGSDFVDAMISTVIETLLIAFGLVAGIVVLFLGRIRAAIIPLIAVPVSIIGAIAVLLAFGATANAITLLALVVAIGIVVDDAIIVVENVERVMEEDPQLNRAEAAAKAMREIVPSIFAITLVLLAVFVPVAFLPGAPGILFTQFAIAVSAAVVISALVAVTLSAAMAAAVLSPGKPFLLLRPLTATVTLAAKSYAFVVRHLLHIAWIAVPALIAVVVWGDVLYKAIPSSYLPAEDKGYIFVMMNLPPGASLERTEAAAQKAEAIVAKDPAVASVGSVLGVDFLAGGTASNSAAFFVALKDYAQRTTPELSSFATVRRLQGELASIPEANLIAANPPAINGLGRVGGLEYVLKADAGQDVADIDAVARHLIGAAMQTPQIATMYAGAGSQTPRIDLDINRELAFELGLDLSELFATLQVMLGGSYINDFNLFGRSWTVRMQAEPWARSTVDDILALSVRSANGEMVRLAAVADASVELGPHTIERYDNGRALRLHAAAAPGVGMGEAIEVLTTLSATELPEGYSFEWTGQALEEIEAAGRSLLLLGLAILFAYLFLVAFYESFLVPIAVLLSVSTAIVGALFGLQLTGLDFGIYAQIGVVILIALAAKNAILIVSFALQARNEGRSLLDATAEGARLRFRPVLMTSIAFIAGLIPLATAEGPGAAAMRAVGVPVLAGMLAASTVGLLLIPLTFFCLEWLAGRTARLRSDATT